MDIEKLKLLSISNMSEQEQLSIIEQINLENFIKDIINGSIKGNNEYYYYKALEKIIFYQKYFFEFIYNDKYKDLLSLIWMSENEELLNIILYSIRIHIDILIKLINENNKVSDEIANFFLFFIKSDNFVYCRKFFKIVIENNNKEFIVYLVNNYLSDLLHSKNSLYELRIFEFLIELSNINKEFIKTFEDSFNFCLCLILKYKNDILEKLNYYEILRSFILNKNLLYLLDKNNIIHLIKEEAFDKSNEMYVLRDSNVILCELINNKIISKYPFNIEILNKIFKNIISIYDQHNTMENLNIIIDILKNIIESKQGTILFLKSKLYPIFLNIIHSEKVNFHNILFDFFYKLSLETKYDLKDYSICNFSNFENNLKLKIFVKVLDKSLIVNNDFENLDDFLNISIDKFFDKVNLPFEESILNYLNIFLNYSDIDKILDLFIRNYKSIEFILNPVSLKELKYKKNELYNKILGYLNKNSKEKYYEDYWYKLTNLHKNYNIYYQTINN